MPSFLAALPGVMPASTSRRSADAFSESTGGQPVALSYGVLVGGRDAGVACDSAHCSCLPGSGRMARALAPAERLPAPIPALRRHYCRISGLQIP